MNIIAKLWTEVNNCENVADCTQAEKKIRAADLDPDNFDELMMAVTYLYREAYKAER
ncbi:MAG: hypothetical protein WC373_17495 [Smithella sp.]|jgi:hypothetical protein